MAYRVEKLPRSPAGEDVVHLTSAIENVISTGATEPEQLRQLNKGIQQKTDAHELICTSEDAQAMIDCLDQLRRDARECRAELCQLIASFAEQKVLASLENAFEICPQTRLRELQEVEEKREEREEDVESVKAGPVPAVLCASSSSNAPEERLIKHASAGPATTSAPGDEEEVNDAISVDSFAYEGDAEDGLEGGTETESVKQEDMREGRDSCGTDDHSRSSGASQHRQHSPGHSSDSSTLSDSMQNDLDNQQKLAMVVRSDKAQQTMIVAQKRENVPPVQRNRKIDSAFHPTADTASQDYPDVMLDIPHLSVEELTLDVQNLRAHVSLDARVASLLQITAGVDAAVDDVRLTVRGVRANALLNVRLDSVREMVNKALEAAVQDPVLMCRILDAAEKPAHLAGPPIVGGV